MRNLKKILALVLALVMSLSLMAVASADDELNLGDVSETYAESVDVLTGLKVFMGNKGEFLPKDNITRAEVAAIIYRIVTGDVTDAQKGIYADYNKFSDVTSDAWYAGYVNYCANAEYVKGVGYDANGKAMFKPQQNVTGYEALAMILRAIGYDRNNEFTGPSWQIQTAATARNRGILKNIAEGTLGGAATREAVAEILCQTILVPVADYSLAFGYRTTDANGKDNETLAYKTFKMEKIDGVVVANEQASLEDTKPLAADQTKLNLADGTAYTLNVASTLNDIGESRYVYVRPAAGTTRYNLVCSKVYDTGLNNVYDSGDKVATVGDSTGKDNGITSITGAQHFVNYDQTDEYTTKIRIEYVLRGRWSDYQARNMRKANGGNLYQWNNTTKLFDNEITALTDKDAANWSNVITDAGNPAGHTYEYRKVINAFTKLSNIDWENIRTVFSTGDLTSGTNIVVGEIYLGTNTHPSNNPEDISDGKYKWETFVADYLEGADNKKQVTTNELGNRLKIVDNNNDGVAEYVLKTIYTVGIITANNNIDIANLNLADGDAVNEVTASTPVINDGEGELAAGNVVIYAKIDGNARAQLAATETAKINTVNRADLTATAEDGTTWKESWVHTHSTYLHSYVSGIYPNTTYTLYFDNYGNLAAYTEGENGGFVLITDGWYRSALNGGEYAVQAYIDGALKTVELTNGGSMFVNNNSSVNNWGMLKRDFGRYTINNEGSTTSTGQIHTIVGTLEGGILTPVDKTYKYSKNMVMLDMVNNAVPGRDGASANVYTTDYADGTAYKAAGTANVTVNALSNTTYYYVFKQGNTTAVRSYTGYGSIPAINNMYIEDVYAVGSLARNAYGQEYYTADVVVVELNSRYDGAMLNAEQVFIPDLAEVTDMVGIGGICNVMMIRGNGAYESVRVNMSKSSLRHYDEASNSENMTKTHAGLYTMTLDEGSTDTYVIKPMSNEQIRANGYMTGYVYKSYNTLDNDYAVVQMKSFGTGNFVPVDPNNMPQLIQSKRVVDTSKTYTLGYDSLYNAKLEESTPANVLSQAGDSAFRDVEESGLNERWDGVANSGNFTNPSLNEVLVRYDGSNVVWAVSFREYRTTDPARRDWAQTVWYSNLVSTEPYDSGITFWGVSNSDAADTNADARNITISHAQALLGQANNMVVDFGDKLNSATSWSLTGGSIIGSITNMTQLAAYNTITNAQETYTLTINRTNGTTETYILVKLAAETNAYLKINNDKLAGIAGTPIALSVVNDSVTPSTATLTLTGTDTWLVEDFIAKFQIVNSLDGSKNPTGTVVPGSKVVWTFWTVGANQTYTVKADNQGNADPTDLANLKNAAVHYMHAFGAISAQVYNEDGIADGNLTEVVTTDASALALAKKEALAKAEEYWNSLTDTQKADPDVKAAYDALVADIYGKDAISGGTADLEDIWDGTDLIAADDLGNKTKYGDLLDAVAGVGKSDSLDDAGTDAVEKNVENGVTTYTLKKDIQLAATETVSSDTVVDLAGYTLTVEGATAFKVDGSGAELTIQGNGTVTSSSENHSTSAVSVSGGATVNVKDGAVLEGGYGVIIGNSGGNSNTINIENATINAKRLGVFVGGNSGTGNTINISSSQINADMGYAVYLPRTDATTNIIGGKLTGALSSVEVRGGTVSLSGVELVSTAENYAGRPVPSGGGAITIGVGLAVTPYQNGYAPVVTANNCVITAPMKVVLMLDDGVTETANTQLKIMNGRDGNVEKKDIDVIGAFTSANTKVYLDDPLVNLIPDAPAALGIGG